ncbi:hypothetical protein V5O48_012041 [Marasmius crinis-equi]|uniref:Uncharacterized protein n=1 Tax=Marasmius crinis-equi TaxID=585013 RepID=A0ABR3F3W2_9AGAR
MDREQRGLLHIAARVSPNIVDLYQCVDPQNGIHFVELVEEDGYLKVIREVTLVDCPCERILYCIPKSLTRCILSGWKAWKEVCANERARYETIAPRADSPDLPKLHELHECLDQVARGSSKRRLEDLQDGCEGADIHSKAKASCNEAESSTSNTQEPPSKRARF